MIAFRIDARQRRCSGTPAVQEAAMSYRILLIALLGLMTSACVPYYESGGYYRSDHYYSTVMCHRIITVMTAIT